MLVITNSGENFVITVMLKIFYLKRSANWGTLFVVEKKIQTFCTIIFAKLMPYSKSFKMSIRVSEMLVKRNNFDTVSLSVCRKHKVFDKQNSRGSRGYQLEQYSYL